MSRFIDPFEIMLRRGNLAELLNFFMRAEERLTAAFPRSSRILAESNAPSAKQVRGSMRRHYLHEALASAASDSGLPTETRWTDPAAWSYPVVKIGGFSLTIGIVETRYRGAARALRTKSQYMEKLCERNAVLDPQTKLFDEVPPSDIVIADGSLGGLIVAQYRPHAPDVPAFLGFWIPSERLNSAYYIRSFDEVIAMLRERLSMSRKPAKRVVERKPLRRRPRKPGDKKA
ncbi:hypothetical protein P1X14_19350 [Sphingomonas sp. AOB5]|uniref:hypothetical protein n=1 Tax=Sphingomonas sp. AOB5 TaxID=3034017 RepID=UPI0023F9E926|nr:hypothetical protein [Sphingomonas sp. AOB5]MDF7777422.1 hypothetical protein [Sphingomonas sp. AOB5]